MERLDDSSHTSELSQSLRFVAYPTLLALPGGVHQSLRWKSSLHETAENFDSRPEVSISPRVIEVDERAISVTRRQIIDGALVIDADRLPADDDER